jgi:hypothetical protein
LKVNRFPSRFEGGALFGRRCHIHTMREETKRAFQQMKAGVMTNEMLVYGLENIISLLEERGFEVHGKTVEEIKEIIRRPPNRGSHGNETP